MNENTPTEAPKLITYKKPKRITKPRAPRVVDPGVAAIHAEAKAKVIELRATRRSEAILNVMLSNRIAQLMDAHKQRLFDELSKTCTPKRV